MESQRPSPDSNEIDLGQLFRKVGSGIRSAWLSFMQFLALLRRVPLENKFSFLGICATSIALAFGYSLILKKNYFESTMILSSHYLNKRLVDNTIEKLDALSREETKSGLARLFGIPDSLADNIIGFEARPFVSEADVIELEVLKEQLKSAKEGTENEDVIEQVIRRIEIENRHSFEITIRTLDAAVIPNLQEALVGYFRNNDYVKRRIEINRINLEARKEKLTHDLEKIDSLKIVIYQNYKHMAEQSRGGSNNVILSDGAVANPVDIYGQDLRLYTELEEVNRNLYLQPDFEIVDDFTEFSEPASPSAAKMAFWALLIGVGIAYLDVAFRSFNTYLSSLN